MRSVAEPVADIFAHIGFQRRAFDKDVRDAAVAMLQIVLKVEEAHLGKFEQLAMVGGRALNRVLEIKRLFNCPRREIGIQFRFRLGVMPHPRPR